MKEWKKERESSNKTCSDFCSLCLSLGISMCSIITIMIWKVCVSNLLSKKRRRRSLQISWSPSSSFPSSSSHKHLRLTNVFNSTRKTWMLRDRLETEIKLSGFFSLLFSLSLTHNKSWKNVKWSKTEHKLKLYTFPCVQQHIFDAPEALIRSLSWHLFPKTTNLSWRTKVTLMLPSKKCIHQNFKGPAILHLLVVILQSSFPACLSIWFFRRKHHHCFWILFSNVTLRKQDGIGHNEKRFNVQLCSKVSNRSSVTLEVASGSRSRSGWTSRLKLLLKNGSRQMREEEPEHPTSIIPAINSLISWTHISMNSMDIVCLRMYDREFDVSSFLGIPFLIQKETVSFVFFTSFWFRVFFTHKRNM